jgi:RNA polymerase sigma factor (sigma-70 family)
LPARPSRIRPDFDGPLRAWARLPPCTAAEERALIARVRAGDTAARDELVGRNLRLVAGVAAGLVRPGREVDDLIGWGWLGLLAAVAEFDPARGVRFATFATWMIRRAIQAGLGGHRRLNRRPAPCLSDLEADDRPAIDVPDYREPPPAAGAERADERARAGRLLAGLPDREAEVVRARFGIGRERLTLADAGRYLGITRERVRQLEARALRKLKATEDGG